MKLSNRAPATITIALFALVISGLSVDAKILCKSYDFYRQIIKKQCERRCDDTYGQAVKNQKMDEGAGVGIAYGACMAGCPIKAKLTSRMKIFQRFASDACTR